MEGKIRILLADDHVVLREATAEVIGHQPDMCVVGQAGTGEKTVALAKELQPDVIVMDIAMPRLDGLAATQQIAAECPASRILVLSAHEDEEHVIPLLAAGASGYLPKTIGLDDLLDAIRATNRGESVLAASVTSVVVRHLAGKTPAMPDDKLTRREMEVLRLLSEGLTNYQVARHLGLRVRTVEAHLTHIYSKLGVGSRTEAVLLAERKGWLATQR
jgi:NarL family two-component system response regulator LiaR